jgi:hypothetical protein
MSKKKTKQWKFMKLNGKLNRKYKVSDQGDVVLAKTMEPLKQNELDKKCPRNGSDYMGVHITGVKSAVRVHRIVCETFHGQAKNGKKLVDHLDEYKDNNVASNLQWVTPSENINRYLANNGVVRYTRAKIVRTKKLINKGWTNDKIAQKVGMSDSNVSSIKLGNIHAAVEPHTTEQIAAGKTGW